MEENAKLERKREKKEKMLELQRKWKNAVTDRTELQRKMGKEEGKLGERIKIESERE